MKKKQAKVIWRALLLISLIVAVLGGDVAWILGLGFVSLINEHAW